MAVELLIPIGRRIIMNPGSIPLSLQGQLSGVVKGSGQAKEVGYAFGRNKRPKQPLMLLGPDERTVILIVGDGQAEAAELEDLAVMKMEQAEEKARKGQRGFDFEAARERRGVPSAKEFDPLFRQALQDSVKRQKRRR